MIGERGTILKEVMDARLSDQIYECSFVPESWPRVLGELAALAGARAGFLFISKNDIHHWTSSTDAGVEALEPLVKSGWVARCERFKRVRAARHSGFVTEPDLYAPEEFRNDPFYRDILYPRGLGWATGTAIELPTGDTFTISLERDYVRGPVEPSQIQTLDELRPHIARSALMCARLQLERARAANATLAALGLAALVVDESGKVLDANPLIEGLQGYIRWRAFDRVSLCDKAADQLLREAIAGVDHGGEGKVRSFPVRSNDATEAMVMHVIPIRLSARDIFERCVAALILTPVTLPEAPPVELVRSLFDLTPTEARVARGLACGKTVGDIAVDCGVSENTIRTHVRGVLQKTGRSRQAEVVALLTGVYAPLRSK
jgi:DNA-binding CsgD family transcriptional regulator